jgi:radical SAM protein with 4Fe4S-binding SPASM domain
VLERLPLLAKHARFTLAFTLLRTNVEEVNACADLAERVGASTAVFRPLYPVGSAAAHLDELMPTFAQYDAALSTLTERCSDEPRVLDPFSPYMRGEAQANTQANYGCGAGNLVCSISASGDVNPCSFLGTAFVAANIREQSLPIIWHDSHTFRAMRALPGGTAETFSGGCRARALAFHGSINAPDPWMESKQSMQTEQSKQPVQPADGRSAQGHETRLRSPNTIIELAGRPREADHGA